MTDPQLVDDPLFSHVPHPPSLARGDADARSRLVRAGLLTAVVDGTFSSVLVAVFYHSTVTRLWQGVASTLIGPSAFERGLQSAALGLLMHVGVAFGWSALFLVLHDRSPGIRRVLASRHGVLKVAAVYGPLVWMTMSLVVIPLLTRRPPTITYRWWVQFFGHIPFVAVPIVVTIGRRARLSAAAA